MIAGVLVIGDDGERVAARVAELRAEGVRAAGFVGDDPDAADEMARELFGPGAAVDRLGW